MSKKIITSGLLGTVVLIIWAFMINGIFGFRSQIDMKPIPNEQQVYSVLKENIKEPGRYISNPEIDSEGRFPENEPVYSVLYGGTGHETAGLYMILGLLIFILSPMIASCLLSQASDRVLGSYLRRFLFIVQIGILVAIFSDMANSGIGNYPLKDAVLLAISNVLAWTMVGLVIAWLMKPKAIPE